MLKFWFIILTSALVIKVKGQDTLRNYLNLIPDKYLGTAVSNSGDENFFTTMYALPNRTYTKKIINNFNGLVAGNELKFDAVQPQQATFNFAAGDILCDFSAEYGMTPRGHTLLWHAQLPSWLGAGSDGYQNNNGYTRDSLLSILKNHITTIVTHFKGRIKEWDVVNEPFEDNGSLRNTIWKQVIGADYLDSAFVWAHQADPDAILVLNEYGNEAIDHTKSDAMFNKIKQMVNNGIPINAAGFQCHVALGENSFTMIRKNFERYHNIGVRCVITELDIKIPADKMGTTAAWEAQGRDYVNFMKLMIETDYCHGIVVWGFADKYSWIPSHSNYTAGEACLFDLTLKPKPAYYAVRDYLMQYLGIPNGVENQPENQVFQLISTHNELYIHRLEPSINYNHISICDLSGRVTDQIAASAIVENSYPVDHLKRGVYVLIMTDNTGKLYHEKFYKF